METKNHTDKEILEQIEKYINTTDGLVTASKEDKSWMQNGFASGVIIGLLLEIRRKLR